MRQDLTSVVPVAGREHRIGSGDFDGIATLDDLLKFFAKLKASAKELYVMQGVAHGTFLQKNYMLAYHGLYSFFLRPEAVYTE